jgi:hypothetical protein
VPGEALGDVDAGLLRHTDIGRGGTAIAVLDQRRAVGILGDVGKRGRRDRHELAVERRVLVARLVEREVDGQIAGGLPARRDAAAVAVILVPAGLARQRVLDRRILVLKHTIELDRDIVVFGQIEVQLGVVRTVVAHASLQAATEFAGGRLEHHRQRAAFGVPAEQGALRPLEHFDALDVIEAGVQAMLTAEVDTIEIDADALFARGLVGVVGNDAANTDRQRRLARFEGGNAQRRNRAVGQVHQALDVALLEIVRAHHRDRDRRLLEVRLALGGGDDDFGQAGAVGFGRSGIGGGCGGFSGEGGADGKRKRSVPASRPARRQVWKFMFPSLVRTCVLGRGRV